MESIENICSTLKRYQQLLSNTGYSSRETQRSVLIYLFLVNEMLEGDLSQYLDDEGVTAIDKALNCLYRNGCIINRPNTIRYSKPVPNTSISGIRADHTPQRRNTENDEPRIIEDNTVLKQ